MNDVTAKNPHRLAPFLRRWPLLLLVLPGAFIGLLGAVKCFRPAWRCDFAASPAAHLTGATIGAVVTLALAVVLSVALVAAERRRDALAARFPDALLIPGRSDWLTMQGAEALGIELPGGSDFLAVVDSGGIRLVAGDELVSDLPWSRVGEARLGAVHRVGSQARHYARLALDIAHEGAVVQLQFPVVAARFPSLTYLSAHHLRALAPAMNSHRA